MVTGDFIGYFAAAGTAAGTLIGLLFVAVSLRPESVLGAGAPPEGRAVAGSAFIALVNSFFVSLIAVIPHTSLGYVAAIMALLSLLYTLRLHRALAGAGRPGGSSSWPRPPTAASSASAWPWPSGRTRRSWSAWWPTYLSPRSRWGWGGRGR